MTRTIIDIHILQTVPPSNLNRDDTGSPKTAVYGGVRRARVSSQAWKRSTRTAFGSLLDRSELGVRTKRVVELVAERITKSDATLTAASEEHAKAVLIKAGVKLKAARKKDSPDEAEFLLFLSEAQISALADAAVQAARADAAFTDALDAAQLKAILDQDHSVDIALFGRMVANLPEMNVDAACQVAHAISVHGVQNEFDYFTAVDDHKAADDEEDAGAGMIGTVEFNSATLYRYATLDVDRLADNLGDEEATKRAATAFVEAFVTSMPTGKQNTFANRTLPDAVLVTVGSRQSVNLVGAFEDALPAESSGGRLADAANKLADYSQDVHRSYGTTPDLAWVVAVGKAAEPLRPFGDPGSLEDLLTALGTSIDQRRTSAP